MLDWSNFNRYISSYQKHVIGKLYREINGQRDGICHVGGNYSQVIIQSGNMAIKIYDTEKQQFALNLIEFHEKYKNKIFKNYDHIQKVYEMKKTGEFVYSIQEWVSGDTLLKKIDDRNLSIVELNLILNDFYLNIIIPFWSKGIIWTFGNMANLCLNDKLVIIDTDSMLESAKEILYTPSSYYIRNKIRLCNNFKHLNCIYDMSLVVKNTDRSVFEKIYSKLNPIYTSPIDDNYFDKSVECFNSFSYDLNEILK